MMFFLLLLAQAAQPSVPPSPPPAAVSTTRDKMAASTEKQREAVKRQTKSLGLHPEAEPAGFFTTPWPRPQPLAAPPPQATASPASYGISRATPWACDPMDPAELSQLVDQTASREQVAPDLLRAVIRQESAGYPCAVSRQGAAGLMQLMPSTARQFAVRDAFNPKQNVEAGARLLRQLIERYPGDLASALAAYNAGTVPVDQHGGVPPYAETQNYVRQILGWLTSDQ